MSSKLSRYACWRGYECARDKFGQTEPGLDSVTFFTGGHGNQNNIGQKIRDL